MVFVGLVSCTFIYTSLLQSIKCSSRYDAHAGCFFRFELCVQFHPKVKSSSCPCFARLVFSSLWYFGVSKIHGLARKVGPWGIGSTSVPCSEAANAASANSEWVRAIPMMPCSSQELPSGEWEGSMIPRIS